MYSRCRSAFSLVVVLGVVLSGVAITGAVAPATAQSEGTVTLTVTTQTTANERIGGVTLVARWDGGSSRATTASNGKAFVDVPPSTRVNISVRSEQYTRNRPYTVEPTGVREHTITVYRKASFDVAVTDGEGPLSDATVELRQDGFTVSSGTTDANGEFSSGTIAQGQYTLAVVKPGYFEATKDVTIAGSPDESVSLQRGSVTYEVRVVDPHFDPPESVDGAAVSVRGVGATETEADGFASIALPVNSELTFEVSKDGYGTKVRTVDVAESDRRMNVSISRRPSLSLTTLNERVVTGERVAIDVVNAYDEPAVGVTVLLDGEDVGQTDDSGRATVLIEETGEHELRARSGSTTSEPVTVEGVASAGQVTANTTATASADSTDAAETTTDGPGFGVVVALVSLLLLVVVAAGRRRR